MTEINFKNLQHTNILNSTKSKGEMGDMFLMSMEIGDVFLISKEKGYMFLISMEMGDVFLMSMEMKIFLHLNQWW